MNDKPTLTKGKLTQIVNEEAKVMRDRLKKEGGHMTFAECKIIVRQSITNNYRII